MWNDIRWKFCYINKYIEKFSFSKATYTFKRLLTKIGEQGSGGVGGCGEHLSPWIHQEYTFRYRKPAESRQEYLTRGKEYIEPHKTQ